MKNYITQPIADQMSQIYRTLVYPPWSILPKQAYITARELAGRWPGPPWRVYVRSVTVGPAETIIETGAETCGGENVYIDLAFIPTRSGVYRCEECRRDDT